MNAPFSRPAEEVSRIGVLTGIKKERLEENARLKGLSNVVINCLETVLFILPGDLDIGGLDVTSAILLGHRVSQPDSGKISQFSEPPSGVNDLAIIAERSCGRWMAYVEGELSIQAAGVRLRAYPYRMTTSEIDGLPEGALLYQCKTSGRLVVTRNVGSDQGWLEARTSTIIFVYFPELSHLRSVRPAFTFQQRWHKKQKTCSFPANPFAQDCKTEGFLAGSIRSRVHRARKSSF